MRRCVLALCILTSFLTQQGCQTANTVAIRGTELVNIAKATFEFIQKKELTEASSSIQALRNGGKELAEWANSQAKTLNDRASRCLTKAEQIKSEVGGLATNEHQLGNQLYSEQSNLNTRVGILKEKQAELSQATHSLSDAQDRLRKAKKKDKDGAIIGAVVGGLLGAFTGGLGAPVGAALGGGLGSLISEIEDEVGKCNQRLRRSQETTTTAENAIKSTEREIRNLKTKINDLSSQIESKKTKRQEYVEWERNVKEVIAFLQGASTFWKEFSMLSVSGVDATDTLKRIIDLTQKTNNFQVIEARGTQHIQMTFIEAWEAVVTKCSTGDCSKFLFHDTISC